MAKYLKGQFYPTEVPSGWNNVVAYASKSTTENAVILLNMHETSNYSYTINFNGTGSFPGFTAGFNSNNNKPFTCDLRHKSTSLLRFTLDGSLIEHRRMREEDNEPLIYNGCNPFATVSTLNSSLCGSTGSASLSNITNCSSCIIEWSTGQTGLGPVYDLLPGQEYWVKLTSGLGASWIKYFSTNINDFYVNKIREDTEWDASKNVSGLVEVFSGNTLSIKNAAQIQAAPNTKFLVHPNAKLNIFEDAVIKNMVACPGLWDGVEITLGGESNMDWASLIFDN
ncbi:MAG: hypothetical protein H0X62_15950 [Bacteroidetes bacterium]|nr:hypothetical protein [Bacteroidota bacterium]